MDMASGAKVALAVGAGYLLGRTRKMKLALMLAGAGVTGKFPARPGDLAAHGLKSLGASADLSQLSQQLRGEVLNAAKAAAIAAATKQVDALNDRLQGVASTAGADEVLEGVGQTTDQALGGVGESVDQVAEPVRSLAGLGGRRSAERDEDVYEEGDRYDGEPSDMDQEDQEDVDDDITADVEPGRDDFEDDEDAGAIDEDDEAEPQDEDQRPARPRRRATRQAPAPRRSGRRSERLDADDEPSGASASRRRAAATATATKRAPVRRGR
jgi:hypothetical protein